MHRELVKLFGAFLLCFASAAHCQSVPLGDIGLAAARLGVDAGTIDELVTANRILAHENILDAYGHVSMRHPTRPGHYLIARSIAPEFVTAADIVEYDLDSNPVSAGSEQGYIERFIHGEIYKARPDVRAIVHTHSAGLIPFSVSSIPLRPVFHMAAFLVGGVSVWDPATTNDPEAAGILVRNPALGASLAAALGTKPVVLMRGHGAVMASGNIEAAVRNAIFTEANARMQLAAIQLGGPIKYISPAEAQGMSRGSGDPGRAWDYWKRRALGK
jgi:ribulose-5-phosphate 4-epimerase/fuculose-1-phosphate aldolase